MLVATTETLAYAAAAKSMNLMVVFRSTASSCIVKLKVAMTRAQREQLRTNRGVEELAESQRFMVGDRLKIGRASCRERV